MRQLSAKIFWIFCLLALSRLGIQANISIEATSGAKFLDCKSSDRETAEKVRQVSG
jgi:hypothetical protein